VEQAVKKQTTRKTGKSVHKHDKGWCAELPIMMSAICRGVLDRE
jgi:hypothetical protein